MKGFFSSLFCISLALFVCVCICLFCSQLIEVACRKNHSICWACVRMTETGRLWTNAFECFSSVTFFFYSAVDRQDSSTFCTFSVALNFNSEMFSIKYNQITCNLLMAHVFCTPAYSYASRHICQLNESHCAIRYMNVRIALHLYICMYHVCSYIGMLECDSALMLILLLLLLLSLILKLCMLIAHCSLWLLGNNNIVYY